MAEKIQGEVVVAKIVDMAFTLLEAGIARQPIVEEIRKMESAGATPDEMTDALQAMRQSQEAKTQAKIDKM